MRCKRWAFKDLDLFPKSFLFGTENIGSFYNVRFSVGRWFVKIAEIAESGLEILDISIKKN